jgi:hypothetical protein
MEQPLSAQKFASPGEEKSGDMEGAMVWTNEMS